jgi:hypothetical protein
VSGTASVTVTAPPVLTSIAVLPASATVQTGATQQFTATGNDQFGQPVSPQPSFTWSVSGGGSIDPASGLFTATSSAGSPFTVTASSGGVNGTASVSVTAPSQDFTLSVSPSSRTVSRGGTATYTVTTGPASVPVTLSLSGQPSGATVAFSANPATGTSTLTVKTRPSTTRQTYNLTINGASGSFTHSFNVTLIVTK